MLPGTVNSDIWVSDEEICSCILAWSSWDSSLVRSASLDCRAMAFCSTACLACSAACRAWSCIALRSSICCSADTNWVANTWAVSSYCWDLAASPLPLASSASTSAWRAEACSRSTSLICRFSFISSCRWLPMTAAACWDRAACWRCASSMACWICTFGSACSSILELNSAIR